MGTETSSQKSNWLLYLLVGLLLIGCGYVAAYRYRSVYGKEEGCDVAFIRYRVVATDAERTLFGPLAWAESKIRGVRIIVIGATLEDTYDPGW